MNQAETTAVPAQIRTEQMTAEDAVSPGTSREPAAPLLVRRQGSVWTLEPGSACWIGRDPAADIVVDEPLVSWRHAVLTVSGDRWHLEDADSTNGTFVAGQRVRHVEITGSCRIRLGHPEAGPMVSCSITGTPGDPAEPFTAVWSAQRTSGGLVPSAVMPPLAEVVRIGRAGDNDVVLADLGVSRRHAELRRSPGGEYEIADLGSSNGTFLNGQPVTTAAVTEADVVGIGAASFRLVGDELREFVDTGDISLEARGLTVTLPNGKVLLDDVSFPLGERCLLGVIGPSGHRGDAQRREPQPLRPAARPGARREGRLFRVARRRAASLRPI